MSKHTLKQSPKTYLHNLDTHTLDYHIARVHQYLYKDAAKMYPIYVEISPTGKCNHDCTFCAVDYLDYNANTLNTTKLKECLTVMGQRGVRSVMFAGEGEPTLHSELPRLVEFAKQQGLDVGITTNGTKADKLVPVMDSLTWIRFSVNGGDEASYNRVHRASPLMWNRLWHNIRRVVKYKGGTTVGIQCVVLPDNVHTLRDLASLAEEAGVDYLVLKPYSQHVYSDTDIYAGIEYKEYYKELSHLACEYSTSRFRVVVRTNTMKYWDTQDRPYSKCHAVPYFWSYIASNGDVVGCSCYLGDSKMVLGNIHETSFDKIWEGNERKELIKKMATWDISKCRINCRMDKCNRYIERLLNPPEHWTFI